MYVWCISGWDSPSQSIKVAIMKHLVSNEVSGRPSPIVKRWLGYGTILQVQISLLHSFPIPTTAKAYLELGACPGYEYLAFLHSNTCQLVLVSRHTRTSRHLLILCWNNCSLCGRYPFVAEQVNVLRFLSMDVLSQHQ